MIVYITFALFSTWKFMFTPIAGPAAGLNYFETLFSCLIGGYLSVSFFYFSSNYFMNLHQQRKAKKMLKAIKKGKKIKLTKQFSRTNKTIVLIKHRLGKWTICWLVPLFLSLPLGAIIVAKFYRHQKNTFLLILLGVTINGTVITSGTYLVYHFL